MFPLKVTERGERSDPQTVGTPAGTAGREATATPSTRHAGRGFMSRGRGNQRYVEKRESHHWTHLPHRCPQRFYFNVSGSVSDWISSSCHGSDVSELQQDCKLVTSHTCLRLRRHLDLCAGLTVSGRIFTAVSSVVSLKSQNLRSKKKEKKSEGNSFSPRSDSSSIHAIFESLRCDVTPPASGSSVCIRISTIKRLQQRGELLTASTRCAGDFLFEPQLCSGELLVLIGTRCVSLVSST